LFGFCRRERGGKGRKNGGKKKSEVVKAAYFVEVKTVRGGGKGNSRREKIFAGERELELFQRAATVFSFEPIVTG